MNQDSPKFWKIFGIVGAIALVNHIFFSFVADHRIMPLMPIPGSEEGKYDGFYSTHAPALIRTLLGIWWITTMLLSLPGALVAIFFPNSPYEAAGIINFLAVLTSIFIWTTVLWILLSVGRKEAKTTRLPEGSIKPPWRN